MKELKLLSIFVLLLSFIEDSKCREFKIGLLAPFFKSKCDPGEAVSYAAVIAVDEINAHNSLISGHNLTIEWKNTECSPDTGLGAATDFLFKQSSVDAFVGPLHSKVCIPTGYLAAYYGVPIISWGCSSTDLSNKDMFPTFARTKPFSRTNKEVTPEVFLTVIRHFEWKYVAILAQDSTTWSPFAYELRNTFEDNGIVIQFFYIFDGSRTDLYEEMLEDVKKRARVIILLCYVETMEKLFPVAREKGIWNGEFAILTMDFKVSDVRTSNTRIFSGLIDIAVEHPQGEEINKFLQIVKSNMTKPPFSFALNNRSASNHAVFLYDAVYLYAHALNRTLASGGNLTDGFVIASNMFNTTFKGISGKVAIDFKGDRIPMFEFSNLEGIQKNSFGTYDPEIHKGHINEQFAVVWPGGGKTKPVDWPKCGFENEKCEDEESIVELVIGCSAAIVVAFLLLFIGITIYRKSRFEKELTSLTWVINYNDIVFNAGPRGSSSVDMQRDRSNSLYSRISNNTYGIETATELFTTVGMYKSNYIAVKKIRKPRISLTRSTLIEMKEVRDINHVNINPYVGACVEPPEVCIISTYCHRGSLQDVLNNEKIKLDWTFKTSFAKDISTGMDILHHSPVRCHGNLKSSNCLVDSRWVCKLTDYGLRSFYQGQDEEADISEDRKFDRLFWTAPEVLNGFETMSQLGDVYSYGIILWEILTRDIPYGNSALKSRDIIELVKKRMSPPFRPVIPEGSCNNIFEKLMRKCWQDEPHHRGDFHSITSTLRKMTKKTNLVDTMMEMMEKYANNLEDLVEERTRQLSAEKVKTDALLYEMIPKVVAEQLKAGHIVKAESFEQVTVYFSDIVGFTNLCGESTPIQVVDFLNDLYSTFDKTIDQFDVYKVETVGDAYMVASGLPERNGNKHAAEIATMSLHLLSDIRDFKIRHKPEKQLQLRIGIHSGPTVAGVIGLKKPRYSLFGDTINYASRMESSGYALRIHVSPSCRNILEDIGGYHLVERGPVTMKGIGTVITYFLKGKDGFSRPLPDLKRAAPISEHEFK